MKVEEHKIFIDALSDIPAGSGIGPESAKVSVMVFEADWFQMQGTVTFVENVRANYPNDVRLIDVQLGSEKDAAAWAAGRQGRFWEMYKYMLPSQANLVREEVAKEMGLDVERFRSDLASQEFTGVVEKNNELSQNLRIPGVPGFVVDGWYRRLGSSDKDLLKYIGSRVNAL